MSKSKDLYNNGFDYSEYPTTRYQGSKRKLLPWLMNTFEKMEFSSCLDLFGGTGSVSYLLKTLGKKVTFNDYLRSNCVSARALIKNNSVRLSKNDFESLFQGSPLRGTVSEVFEGVFYTNEENEQIDTLIHRIRYDPEKKLTSYRQDIALHTLFQSLLMKRPFNLFHRANLYLRMNDVKRNFGNKTTWETPLKDLMERIRKETNNAVFNNGEKHEVINMDALEVSAGYDLIYIDPPYYPSDGYGHINYLDYYHFLEGLCIYDEWKKNINFNKKSLPLKDKHSSFQKHSFIDDLENLFEIHNESIITMSYKSPGYPSLKKVKKLLNKTHKKIKVSSVEHSYSLNKNNGHYKEILIVGYPKN